jgi:hypothetical protein
LFLWVKAPTLDFVVVEKVSWAGQLKLMMSDQVK